MTAPTSVLVVDDDEDIRTVIELTLGLKGYEVRCAEDGLEALEQLHADANASVILLDLRMPRMNGIEFLHALRSDPSLARIPVVVLTGDSAAATEAMTAGANGLLLKPIDSRALFRSIEPYVS